MCKAIEELRIMEREQGIEIGIDQGIEQGIEIGKEQSDSEHFANLINCQQNGVITIEQAATIAGMTVEEYLEKMTLYLPDA